MTREYLKIESEWMQRLGFMCRAIHATNAHEHDGEQWAEWTGEPLPLQSHIGVAMLSCDESNQDIERPCAWFWMQHKFFTSERDEWKLFGNRIRRNVHYPKFQNEHGQDDELIMIERCAAIIYECYVYRDHDDGKTYVMLSSCASPEIHIEFDI